MPNQPTIAATMIVRDEIRHLPDLISSLDDCVDQIVVVDTGSVDGTREWLEHLAETDDRVILADFEWCQDFAAARNVGLRLATTDWILSIDADERLVCPDAGALRRALGSANTKLLTLSIDILNDSGAVGVSFRGPRLFIREGSEWRGRVHEGPFRSDSSEALEGRALDRGLAHLVHLGGSERELARKGSLERNAAIALAALEDPTDETELGKKLWDAGRSLLGVRERRGEGKT